MGRELARRLGWDFIDSDDQIVSLAGKSIPQIFAQDGEHHFRSLERQVLEQACRGTRRVIATGGGAVVNADNRALLSRTGVVVCLDASPETIYRRLLTDNACSEELAVRPLLLGDDPLSRISKLKTQRQHFYAAADWTVATDGLSLEQVVEEVLRGWRFWRPVKMAATSDDGIHSFEVVTASARYPVCVGWDLLPELGDRMRQLGLGSTATIVSDEEVYQAHGDRAARALREAGFTVNTITVPPGEASKTLDSAISIYDFLVEHRIERSDPVVALGGGVVGDLAGFVAATFLRGLPLVQVPTSLLAMVDASVGGKVAVNHPRGKNLIGAFYQPRLVLADLKTLTTLPRRELTSGWAEVIKHALILDKSLFRLLETQAEALLQLESDPLAEAVSRSAAIKAGLVAEDEREEKDRRTILNYGHTIGHGLEAATDYRRFLHGEAVAIGMVGAARLGHRLGLTPAEVVSSQQRLLERFGLPVLAPGVPAGAVLRAMELDKKVRHKALRWVLLKDIGETVIRDDVPQADVQAVVCELLAARTD